MTNSEMLGLIFPMVDFNDIDNYSRVSFIKNNKREVLYFDEWLNDDYVGDVIVHNNYN